MDWAHPELLDLVPATLLATIVTASWLVGFTLGAAAAITGWIILPALPALTRKALHP